MDNCQIDSNLQFFSDAAIIVGCVLLAITIKMVNTSAGLNGQIIGYAFLASGFIVKSGLLMSLLLGNCLKDQQPLMFFLTSVLPFIITVLVIFYIISILNSYFNRITTGKVTKGFDTFTRMFIVVLIAQFAIFYNSTSSDKYKKEHTISPVYGMSIYLLSIINMLIAITINIILAYYSTDG
jgi:hypothetical protein